MNPDELRALADALEPMAKAPRFEDFDVPAFCAWVRACADAEPVAWRTFDGEGNYDYRAYELSEDYADEWNRRNPNHVGWVEPLYALPAPAAPQAEPKREPRPCTCHPDEARDALLDFISENGTASEGVQHYLDRYVRAALAAKDNGNAGE